MSGAWRRSMPRSFFRYAIGSAACAGRALRAGSSPRSAMPFCRAAARLRARCGLPNLRYAMRWQLTLAGATPCVCRSMSKAILPGYGRRSNVCLRVEKRCFFPARPARWRRCIHSSAVVRTVFLPWISFVMAFLPRGCLRIICANMKSGAARMSSASAVGISGSAAFRCVWGSISPMGRHIWRIATGICFFGFSCPVSSTAAHVPSVRTPAYGAVPTSRSRTTGALLHLLRSGRTTPACRRFWSTLRGVRHCFAPRLRRWRSNIAPWTISISAICMLRAENIRIGLRSFARGSGAVLPRRPPISLVPDRCTEDCGAAC